MESQGDKQHGEQKADEESADPQPNGGARIDAPKPEPATQECEDKPNCGCRRDEGWKSPHVIVQVVLVIIAFFAACIYYGQLKEMQRNGELTKRNYALQTKTLRLDERAWVAPETVSGKAEKDKTFTITVIVKNTGKTFRKEIFWNRGLGVEATR
jgi:hypothetical protein